MDAKRQTRRRTVRLTDEARERLGQALVERWRTADGGGKLTRERRADLLGMSVATVDKLLTGKGVDRPTVTLAFKSVGLPWEDRLCEPVPTEVEMPTPKAPDTEPPVSVAAPPPDAFQAILPETTPGRRRPVVRLRTFSAVAVLGALAILLTRPGAEPAALPERTVFNRQLERTSTAYLDGAYRRASLEAQASLSIARGHGSVGELASALRAEGDVACAAGTFRKAKDDYTAALDLWIALRLDRCKPPLWEVLGDVETKMGDFAGARHDLWKALKRYREFQDPVGIALSARDLGSLAFQEGDLHAATLWFDLSLDALLRLAKPEIVMDVKARQALVLREQGRLGEARSHLRRCLDYWSRRQHPRWIALTEFQLGTVEAAANDLGVATDLLSKSETAYERLGDAYGTTEAKRWLTKVASWKVRV